MELTEQIIAELRSLVEQIAIEQPTPTKKFLFEMIFGLCASGSVLLTEVGRKLPADISLHAVEKRLSANSGLKDGRMWRCLNDMSDGQRERSRLRRFWL